MSDIERARLTNGGWKNRLELYKAAMSNDWEKAESIYKKPGMKYGVIITSRGETALHISCLAGHINFVENLVKKMKEDDIRKETRTNDENLKGNTAFHCAAISGNVKIAQLIIIKDNLSDLTMARGVGDLLPIHMAALKGNKEMVRYLYKTTKHHLEDDNQADLDKDRRNLLLALINSDIYDVALEMARALLDQRIAPKSMEEEALQALAQKPLNTSRSQDRSVACELIQVLWDEIAQDEKRITVLIEKDENIIIHAAKRGNFEFLSILIASYPDVLFAYDANTYTIFHHAIMNRHVDIFKLIHVGSVKTVVTTFQDMDENNMLHLAGKLAPPSRLNIVPGAALQLQLELLWFEEVKKVMEPHEVNRKIKLTEHNNKPEEYTPHELFVKEHKDLMEEGEKWMRDTANSCMIVAALITTIAFAAAITVPGGNGDDGYPQFLKKLIFDIFIISDSISLISSATSLLDFLSILTARYTIDDFRWSLPNKLFIGLLTLFVSVVAMMVAFVLSVFIIFKDRPLVFTIVIVSVSALPIILFIWQHFYLFFDVFRSTYTSYLLFKSRKDPNLLIKDKKKTRKSNFLSLRACGKAIIDC